MKVEKIIENHCYRIIQNDEDLIRQFPELKIGCEFRAIAVENGGLTALRIFNGKFIDINEHAHASYWCFFGDCDLFRLEEIPCLIEEIPDLGKGELNGQRISTLLASQSELMKAASEYIIWLESQLK